MSEEIKLPFVRKFSDAVYEGKMIVCEFPKRRYSMLFQTQTTIDDAYHKYMWIDVYIPAMGRVFKMCGSPISGVGSNISSGMIFKTIHESIESAIEHEAMRFIICKNFHEVQDIIDSKLEDLR